MKPAALFRWETTAAGRTHSYGLGELTNEVCATQVPYLRTTHTLYPPHSRDSSLCRSHVDPTRSYREHCLHVHGNSPAPLLTVFGNTTHGIEDR